jgi:uncharacterized OB-fold protein
MSSTLRRPAERGSWTCENCARVTDPPRKRCAGCGTSRY